MTGAAHPVIQRYAAGDITAMRAAALLGGRTTVADVVVMLRQAGLQPPRPAPEREAAELAHALRVLHLDREPTPGP